ncbi:hypothetical protein [Cupriavidus respiraculi]|nr:hypothetical protein [Cupriavidus respiraculi]MBY4949566.1 hypothetical protein [Cupriavidus respiraculi]
MDVAIVADIRLINKMKESALRWSLVCLASDTEAAMPTRGAKWNGAPQQLDRVSQWAESLCKRLAHALVRQMVRGALNALLAL